MNDNDPFFPLSLYEVNLDENNLPGAKIVSLQARDLDEGDNARLSYSLSQPSPYFRIDSDSGAIFTEKTIDAEKLEFGSIMLEIFATDFGIPRRKGSTKLRIKINDVNDNVPRFQKKKYEFSVAENKEPGCFVGQVKIFTYGVHWEAETTNLTNKNLISICLL